jgi:SAM-dependent methyltransferase
MVEPVVWTPDLVDRFWDSLTETKLLDIGFSRLSGRYLLHAIKWHLTPGSRHLDFGAGDGDFVRLLAENGYPAAALEKSVKRRQAIVDSLSASSSFLGALGPESQDTFDAVFMIEVIEHVLDEEMAATLELVRRLLAPSGKLIITTPNSENLDHAMCVCPADGTVFHRWQHVRSFSAESLTRLLSAHGFEPLVIHHLELSDRIFGEHGANLLRNPFWANLFETERPLSIGTGENLIWIGGHSDCMRRAGRGDLVALSEPVLALDVRIALEPRLSSISQVSHQCTTEPGAFEHVLAPREMAHVAGHCWSVPVGSLFGMGDWDAEQFRSRLRLREDGLELGPAHSSVSAIKREGSGRFSHRGPDLFFSASDNTPPDRNGRRYAVSGPPAIGADLAGQPAAPIIECRLDPQTIVAVGGYCWGVNCAELFEPGDTVAHPRRSCLEVYESGVPLGPSHSDHVVIREVGGGCFSHWGEWVYFSSSENLPPGRNRRSYMLRGPAAPQSSGKLWLAIGGPHRLGWVRRLDQP